MPLNDFWTTTKAYDNMFALYIWVLETYSELFQTIKVGLFTEIVNGFSQQLKAIFAKNLTLDACQGF